MRKMTAVFPQREIGCCGLEPKRSNLELALFLFVRFSVGTIAKTSHHTIRWICMSSPQHFPLLRFCWLLLLCVRSTPSLPSLPTLPCLSLSLLSLSPLSLSLLCLILAPSRPCAVLPSSLLDNSTLFLLLLLLLSHL